MRNGLRISFVLVAGIIAACGPVFAHHGSSISYDLKKTVVLKGSITEFVWSNPHCQIYFDVKGDQGNVAHWGGETNGPGTLAKDGWTKTTLKPGDQITITVFPSKAGTPYGLVSKVVLPSGKEFVPVSPETAAKRTDGQASPPY
jgi:Family of unknown function (DUF6152)